MEKKELDYKKTLEAFAMAFEVGFIGGWRSCILEHRLPLVKDEFKKADEAASKESTRIVTENFIAEILQIALLEEGKKTQ